MADVVAVARGLYGEAFGSSDRQDLEAAVGEWQELSAAERSFATVHLLYLALEAQAATQSLLQDVRDALEELEIRTEAPTDVPLPAPDPLPFEAADEDSAADPVDLSPDDPDHEDVDDDV